MPGILNMLVGGAPMITVTLSPLTPSTSTGSSTNDTSFSISVTGGTPSSYLWTADGACSIVGSTTASGATGRCTDSVQGDLNPASGNVYCAVVVNGVTYNVSTSKTHSWL